MKRIVAILALLFWLQPAQAGELARGLSAYRAGNYGEAVALFRPLAQQGDPWAQYSLAVAYDDGLGVPRNFKLALEWYRRAGYQGLADAQYMTGRFYGNGRGVRQDPAKALFWFELAAAGGFPLAPLLRDQHYNQLKEAVRLRVSAEATEWQARHPQQMNCKFKNCIYPKWTKRPMWFSIGDDQYYPGFQ
jgi:TPR repeat protein